MPLTMACAVDPTCTWPLAISKSGGDESSGDAPAQPTLTSTHKETSSRLSRFMFVPFLEQCPTPRSDRGVIHHDLHDGVVASGPALLRFQPFITVLVDAVDAIVAVITSLE